MGASAIGMTPKQALAFRERHNMNRTEFMRRLALHNDHATRIWDWETNVGAPTYVAILYHLIDNHGWEVLDALVARAAVKGRLPKLKPEDVRSFRERHKLSARGLAALVGSIAQGRGVRLWGEEGATPPAYLGILFAYADAFGTAALEKAAAALPHNQEATKAA